ncbi:ATP-binding protein [Planctopirus hydrillae]|nr:ATP-binding protein [Planctopirus hydrillae]
MFALHRLLSQPLAFEVHSLFTTYCEESRLLAIHGTPLSLIQAQARSMSIPVDLIPLPDQSSNIEYETRLAKYFSELKSLGVNHVVFGDLFVEEIRAYREGLCARQGMTSLFPLWKLPPEDVVPLLIAAGYRSIVCSVLAPCLNAENLGCELDHQFLESLPAGVDPAGENGEYHSLVVNGPRFQWPIVYRQQGIRHEGAYRQCEFGIA